MEKLLTVADVAELYGLSTYQARNLMEHVERVNIGQGSVRPRWRTTETAVDAYLARLMRVAKCVVGLDSNGKVLRRK